MDEVSQRDGALRERAEEADRFILAAQGIMVHASREGIVLRLLGSLAYRLRCPENAHLLDEMQRVLTDLDFASQRRYANQLDDLLARLGYIPDPQIAEATGGSRHFFKHPETGLGVDIFVERLFYCHPISFKGRLEIDPYTLPLAELLLEKMQIVELNEKDIKDTIVLLLEHDLGEEDGEVINISQVNRILTNDWGFYYTVTTNLRKVESLLSSYPTLSASQQQLVRDRVTMALRNIEEAPKTARWKIRARVGPRVRWYQDVEAKEP